MTLPAKRSSSSLGRRNPPREFQDLYDQMNQWMASMLGDGSDLLQTWSPLADISETSDAYTLEVDVPGAKPDDVNVEMMGNDLVISGEIKEKEREGLFHRRTRRVGRFEYRATLPRDVDENGIDAKLTDGVLTVRIPKSDVSKAHKIAVTGG